MTVVDSLFTLLERKLGVREGYRVGDPAGWGIQQEDRIKNPSEYFSRKSPVFDLGCRFRVCACDNFFSIAGVTVS